MTQQYDNKDGQFPYLKIFPEEYLSGSLHYENSLEEQGYFIGLCAIAARNRKRRGSFMIEKGRSMTQAQIANALFIDEAKCKRLWDKMVEQERVAVGPDGVWYVANFEYYQYRYRRGHAAKDMSRQIAMNLEQDERTRKMVRKNPDTATDELIKISERKAGVNKINENVEKLKEKGRH